MQIKKSIYGMVQAGRNWWKTLDGTYKELGFRRSQADQCVRSRTLKSGETITGTYTDVILGGSSSVEEMDRTKKELGEKYHLKETDSIQFALGMRLTHDRAKGIATLSMKAYFNRFFAKYHIKHLKSASTPFPPGIALSSADSPKSSEDKYFMSDKPYAEMVGALQFAAAACRPDIAFATNVLSRYTKEPGRAHWNALVHVLRYVNGSRDYSITYSADSPDALIPCTYVDADYAACTDTRRSTTGILTMMTGGPTFWMSK